MNREHLGTSCTEQVRKSRDCISRTFNISQRMLRRVSYRKDFLTFCRITIEC
jgi:hypothetical protein